MLRRIAPPFCLALLSLAIWCTATSRWSVTGWQTPLDIQGDALEICARIQTASENLSIPLRGYSALPRLAAPIGADWSRYPISDRVVFSLLGLLARGVGLFAAWNIAIAAVHVLNALAFYFCARFLRWRWEWAFAIALLFSFSSYNFRWGPTISLSLTFAIPPLLLLCGWICRPAPAIATRGWTWGALALGVWFGGANPYFGFFAAQLVFGATLLQWLRRRAPARWRTGALLLATMAVSFLLHNAAYFLAPTADRPRLTLARNYAGSEIYALKLTDLVIPPAEHFAPPFAEIGRAYQAQSALDGEFFTAYLGVFGILGLGILLASGRHAWARNPPPRVPYTLLAVMWTLAFSAVGGVNSLLALAGLDVFRASNRNSIFLLVWALFFFGRWCQRLTRPRGVRVWLRYSLPLLITLVGVADSVPRIHARSALKHNAAALTAERELLTALERRIGPGAMIFQLPATVFPEAGTVGTMGDYAHFSPYLLSSTLRVSYGSLRGTDASRWITATGRLPAPALKEELESAGFRALWIDRRGLPGRGETLSRELQALGLESLPQTWLPDVEIFLLQPTPHPRRIALDDARFYEPWDGVPSRTEPKFAAIDGWYDLERNGEDSWRWAGKTATTRLPLSTDTTIEVTFRAYSLAPGELVITCDGNQIYRRPISPSTRDASSIRLSLKAGNHLFEWRFSGRLVRPGKADGRQLGFSAHDLKLTLLKQKSDGSL